MIYGILGAVGLSICALVISFMMRNECVEKAKHFNQLMMALEKDDQDLWRRFMEYHNI